MAFLHFFPCSCVKVGTKLQADGGFPCITEGTILEVKANAQGTLYVDCGGPDDEAGTCEHTLDGQLSEDGSYYVGFLGVAS